MKSRTGLRFPSSRAQASASAPPKRRADCSITVIDSNRTGRSRRRGSYRRRLKIKPASKRIWRTSSADSSISPKRICSNRCEQTVRNYDPCISCATHFLPLEMDRG